MPKQTLEPHRVTKPIQLLAAWLLGLVSIDGAFLTAAKMIDNPSWIPGVLVIASVINVPLFLICIFILQTKFRPEMQEDTFYSKYLEKRQVVQTGESVAGEIQTIKKQVIDSNSKVLEFVESFQTQVVGLAEVVGSLAEKVGEQGETVGVARQIESQLQQAKAYLEVARKHSEWNQIDVSINDLLPNYLEIVNRFEAAGINISETFGSTSVNAEKPSQFIISVGARVPVENVREMLSLITDFGVAGIDIIELGEEPDMDASIIIGSYSFKYQSFAPLSKELLDGILNPSLTTEEFQKLVRSKYQRKK